MSSPEFIPSGIGILKIMFSVVLISLPFLSFIKISVTYILSASLNNLFFISSFSEPVTSFSVNDEIYFDNLSLAEIAENTGKSRNAIHKGIKSVCNKLYEYEDILKIYEKSNKLKEIISKIDNNKIKEELEGLL